MGTVDPSTLHPNSSPHPFKTFLLPSPYLLLLQPFVAAGIQQQQQQQQQEAADHNSSSSSSSIYLPLLACDDVLLRHAPPVGSSHPERPDRTAAIMARLRATGLVQRCKRVSVTGMCSTVRVFSMMIYTKYNNIVFYNNFLRNNISCVIIIINNDNIAKK
jgi:hypothetical protein